MKKILSIIVTTIALCGCTGHTHKSADVHDEHIHMHSFTAYTHNAEFFLQHEGLELGKKACITLYATALADFKPMEAGEASILLRAGGESHEATAHAHAAGMFHFELTPETAGEGMLYVTVGEETAHFDVAVTEHCNEHAHEHNDGAHSHGGDGHEGHDHSGHSHAHSHAPHPGHGSETPAKSGDVQLTKEQSWKIDFATTPAVESNFGGTVKVVAKAEALPGNFTTVVATTSGKVRFAGNVVAGTKVAANEPLFYLEGSDVTDNDAAVKFAEAESNYKLSKADYERKKNLFSEKVVSEREYQAAEAQYKQAKARYESMQRNFGAGKVTLKSSFAGYIASMLVSNGDYVQPGTPLATVQRDGGMNIVAELPVRYSSMLQRIDKINVELPSGEVYDINALGGSLQAVGSAVNSCNMLPVTVSSASIPGVVPGCIVTLYLSATSGVENSVAVPRTSLVEEMGNLFVFVQNSPVSFEKRSVKVGETDGYLVQLLDGVKAGERVVSKGGVILKLSQGAAALDPHAGHVH